MNKGNEAPPTRKHEIWQILKDEKELQGRLEREREKVKPDHELIESLKVKLRGVRTELKGH